jgi:hypothetical protein
MTKNFPKCPLFDSIQQYLTLFNFKKGIRLLHKTNRLAKFDLIWALSSKTNTKYFQIIFFNKKRRIATVAKVFSLPLK